MDEFEHVQSALPAALGANVPGSGVDHVVVTMPSFSVGETLLAHYAPKLPAMAMTAMGSAVRRSGRTRP